MYADEEVLVASKPNHLLVHRTDLAHQDRDNLRERLISEGSLNYTSHPVNRIDRPTSGLVVFSKTPEAHRMLHEQFTSHTAKKKYWAVVRGWLERDCTVDKPLATSHNQIPKPAFTSFSPLAHFEWNESITRYPTSRFSLVACTPTTGRYHQIRLHLRHLRHPIIGDTAHGDKPHNRFFEARFEHRPLYLHAGELSLTLPNGKTQTWLDPLPASWNELVHLFGWTTQTHFIRT